MNTLRVTDRELVLIMDVLNDQASELKERLESTAWSTRAPSDYISTRAFFREVKNLADRVEDVVNQAIDGGKVFSDT